MGLILLRLPSRSMGIGVLGLRGVHYSAFFFFSLKALETQTQEPGETYLFIVGKGLGEVV